MKIYGVDVAIFARFLAATIELWLESANSRDISRRDSDLLADWANTTSPFGVADASVGRRSRSSRVGRLGWRYWRVLGSAERRRTRTKLRTLALPRLSLDSHRLSDSRRLHGELLRRSLARREFWSDGSLWLPLFMEARLLTAVGQKILRLQWQKFFRVCFCITVHVRLKTRWSDARIYIGDDLTRISFFSFKLLNQIWSLNVWEWCK